MAPLDSKHNIITVYLVVTSFKDRVIFTRKDDRLFIEYMLCIYGLTQIAHLLLSLFVS